MIGRLELGGAKTIGTALHHWNEVLNSPRRQIAEWHKLKDWIRPHWSPIKRWNHRVNSNLFPPIGTYYFLPSNVIIYLKYIHIYFLHDSIYVCYCVTDSIAARCRLESFLYVNNPPRNVSSLLSTRLFITIQFAPKSYTHFSIHWTISIGRTGGHIIYFRCLDEMTKNYFYKYKERLTASFLLCCYEEENVFIGSFVSPVFVWFRKQKLLTKIFMWWRNYVKRDNEEINTHQFIGQCSCLLSTSIKEVTRPNISSTLHK